MTTGQRIKDLRKTAGYSRVTFAEKIGMPQTTLRNYENDEREPGHGFLIKIAKEFNVTTDYLLGLTEKDEEKNATIEEIDNDVDQLFEEIREKFGNLTESKLNLILKIAQAIVESDI